MATHVNPTPIDELDVPRLNEEQQAELKKRLADADKLLEDKQLAKYKLELMFGPNRSAAGPTIGILSFWESGAKLHGGGDTKLYMCGGKPSGKNECEAFIPDASTGYGFLVCPECGSVWKGPEVTGEIIANLTMQNWAHVVHKYFVRLGHNADIYVRHAKEELRKKAQLEQEFDKGGELLDRARSKRVKYIYPLKNIIRDTANGADLLTQFYKLLKA